MSDKTHSGIYAALAAAQSEMRPAMKDSVNPHFKMRYADLASVMAACMPALSKHGIAVIQPPCDIDGNRYVKTILAHVGGETVECLVPLIIGKNDMQGYGSAVTYARRYGLMAMAGIAPDDDDGNAAVEASPKQDQRRADQPKTESRQEPRQPDGLSPKALADARAYLDAAATLPDLQSRWQEIPTAVQRDVSVQAAKDARKSALQLDDEIPY